MNAAVDMQHCLQCTEAVLETDTVSFRGILHIRLSHQICYSTAWRQCHGQMRLSARLQREFKTAVVLVHTAGSCIASAFVYASILSLVLFTAALENARQKHSLD